jgi:hypothetical protein
MTRLELGDHPNEITVGSQTGMRKGNQYALTWPDINFKLRLITLPDTKTGVPHTVPMTDGVYEALKDQQDIQARMQELRGDRETKRMKLDGRVFTIRENREWRHRGRRQGSTTAQRRARAALTADRPWLSSGIWGMSLLDPSRVRLMLLARCLALWRTAVGTTRFIPCTAAARVPPKCHQNEKRQADGFSRLPSSY